MEENNIGPTNSHQLWVIKLGVRLISSEEQRKTVYLTKENNINSTSIPSLQLLMTSVLSRQPENKRFSRVILFSLVNRIAQVNRCLAGQRVHCQ